MNENKKNLLILGSIFVIVIVIALLSTIKLPGKTLPKDTIGNTAGNLNNGGLFCEYDGKVYFSNAYDNGTLYVMNSDETEVSKLNDSNVSLINASESYLVYYRSGNLSESGIGTLVKKSGIFRSNLKGKNVKCLDDSICTALILTGNQIYYQHYNNTEYTRLYKADINGESIVEVEDAIINPHCVVNGTIYFNGTDGDHYLYGLNTETDSISTLWTGNLWNPIVEGNYVYYMDLSNHYGLSRYSLLDNTVEILTNDRVDYFNVYENMIYYQTASSDSPCLKRMYTDGSNNEIVKEGSYKNINITSNYVYFTAFESETPVYHTPTFSKLNVTVFQPQE